MSEILYLNPYTNMSFFELVDCSNNLCVNFCPQKALLIMREFARRLQLETDTVSAKLKELSQ